MLSNGGYTAEPYFPAKCCQRNTLPIFAEVGALTAEGFHPMAEAWGQSRNLPACRLSVSV